MNNTRRQITGHSTATKIAASLGQFNPDNDPDEWFDRFVVAVDGKGAHVTQTVSIMTGLYGAQWDAILSRQVAT